MPIDPAVDRPGLADLGHRRAGHLVGRRLVGFRSGEAESGGHAGAERGVDVGQGLQLAFADRRFITLTQFKGVRADHMFLLHWTEAAIEQGRLAEMVVEGCRLLADLGAGGQGLRNIDERACVGPGVEGAAAVQ